MPDFERQAVDATRLPEHLLAKWSSSILAEGFVPFPKKFVRTLSALFGGVPELRELAVILAVVDFKRPNATREPSLDYLAFLAGLTAEEFENALGHLIERGYATLSGNPYAMDIDLVQLERAIEQSAT